MTNCGTGAFNNRDYGSCPRDLPYCNDSGFCQDNKENNYTGLKKAYNNKFYFYLYLVIGLLVGSIVLFLLYKKFIKK